jgi:hypothetical protein
MILFFLFLCLAVPAAQAAPHEMIVKAKVGEGGSLLVNVRFGKDAPAKDVKVNIYRPNFSFFADGKTDEKGNVTFAPEGPKGIWKVIASDSLGHRGEATFQWKGAEAVYSKTESPVQEKGRSRWLEIIAGLGFIAGVSGLLLSCYLLKELRKVKNALPGN